jgi:acetolactate synthase-1/3 small subunit
MDVGQSTMILEITGTSNKIDDFLALLTPYTILEIARSGIVSMERGKKLRK